MNFDGESILFDDLGAATSSLPMCVRVVDLAHDTSIAGDISHSSIAGIADNFQFELGPTQRPPSLTFSGRARTHDCTPRAHLHQSPICLRGRRNHSHHNANRAARRIGVTMSRSQGWSVSPQKTTGRLLSNITYRLI